MPLNSLRPGSHDPHNANSVKLAAVTRIKLVLPGLGKDEDEGNPRAKGSKLAGDGSTETKKKLKKIQNIVKQAEQAHAGIIVNASLLADDTSESSADGSKASQSAGSSESAAANGSNSRHTSKQRTDAAGSKQKGKSAAARAGAAAAKCSSRSLLPAAAQQPIADADAAARQNVAASKPHVPIWERNPTSVVDKKPTVSPPKVLQPLAVKMFSPTLGSLGSTLGNGLNPGQVAGPGRYDAEDPRSARSPASSRTKSAAKSFGFSLGRVEAANPHSLSSRAPAASIAEPSVRSKSFTYAPPSRPLDQLLEKWTLD